MVNRQISDFQQRPPTRMKSQVQWLTRCWIYSTLNYHTFTLRGADFNFPQRYWQPLQFSTTVLAAPSIFNNGSGTLVDIWPRELFLFWYSTTAEYPLFQVFSSWIFCQRPLWDITAIIFSVVGYHTPSKTSWPGCAEPDTHCKNLYIRLTVFDRIEL